MLFYWHSRKRKNKENGSESQTDELGNSAVPHKWRLHLWYQHLTWTHGQVPGAPLPLQLQAYGLEKQQRMDQVLEPLVLCGSPRRSSWLQGSGWPRSGHCIRRGREPDDGRCLSFSVSPSLYNCVFETKMKNKSKSLKYRNNDSEWWLWCVGKCIK